MIRSILELLVRTIEIYSFLCFIRIIITWLPGVQFTAIGRFFSALCDPFLNIFRGVQWLKFGGLDFSPALAIGLLYAVSYILQNILRTGRIYFGAIIAILIGTIWSIAQSFLFFIIVLLIIRLIVIIVKKEQSSYGSIWGNLDYVLRPLAERMSKVFVRNKYVSYRTSLIIAILMIGVTLAIGSKLIGFLMRLSYLMPF